MKNIVKAVLVLSMITALFSCTLDLRQPGAIDADDAMTTMQDAQNLRRGLYVNFRGSAAGGFISNAEVQSDLFQASSGYGNNYGYFYRWDFDVTEGACESVWGSCYGVIANANYFIENAQRIMENPTDQFSADDLEELSVYIGEAYFLRAYYHFQLAMMYCPVYDESTANNPNTGIPYVTKFNPTADKSTYPNRGTLAETYSMINEDLDQAENLITTPGSVGSMWITADVVAAFRTRVYLNMKDYEQVIAYGQPLLSSNRYPLASTQAALNNMWVNDSGEECLMMLWADNKTQNRPSSYDVMYISYNVAVKQYQPGFIPTQAVINSYDQNDWRFAQFFERRMANEPTGSAEVYLFEKFPGNASLNPTGMTSPQSIYLHKNKPFRIAEVYLNLAEAYAQSNRQGDAQSTLVMLRSARIPGYQYQGTDVMEEIKIERLRELIGEGFRLWDLKRWGDPVDRGEPQNELLMYTNSALRGRYEASNPRFVWPIPKAEMDANPNIGAQNPGY